MEIQGSRASVSARPGGLSISTSVSSNMLEDDNDDDENSVESAGVGRASAASGGVLGPRKLSTRSSLADSSCANAASRDQIDEDPVKSAFSVESGESILTVIRAPFIGRIERQPITQKFSNSSSSGRCPFVCSSRKVSPSPVFRCVLSSLYEALSVGRLVHSSVRPSVCPSVRNAFFKNLLNAL